MTTLGLEALRRLVCGKMGEIWTGISLLIYILLLSSSSVVRIINASSPGGGAGAHAGEIESCSLQTPARFSPSSSSRLQVNNNNVNSSVREGGGAPVLVCQIRTLHSDLNLTSLVSVRASAVAGGGAIVKENSVESVVKLKLICNDLLFFESVLQSGQLRPFSGLQELEIERCKLKIIRGKSLEGLVRLRRLTIQTGNADWPARSLEISPGAFTLGSYKSLEDLQLGYNNIRTLPGDFLCQVRNLETLNLTHNLLSNINDLGLTVGEDGEEDSESETTTTETTSSTEDVVARSEGMSSCGSALKSLDLSFNSLQSLGKFRLLTNVESLRLDHNRIEELQPATFHSLVQLRSLNLSSNSLNSLPPDAFSSSGSSSSAGAASSGCCRHLRELYLQNNSLSELLPGLFAELEHLHTLDLSHNQLSNSFMSVGTFSSLTRLVVLNLSGNQLSGLSPTMFSALTALQLLDLSDNLITSISDSSFDSLKNLHALNLARNRLSSVDARTFAGLPVLRRLLLDYNSISTVHPDAFNSTRSLQDISLVRNQLESVPEAIQNLPVRTLDLGENRIKQVVDNLVGLNQLYGLRLAGNELREIGKRFCQSLPRLRALNLAQNKISKIELTAFVGCPQLKVLRLDSNNITVLPPSFSTELQSLLWLNVSTNKLEFLDYTSLPQKLEWLDFSFNSVRSLWGGSVPGLLGHLRILDGNHNNLSALESSSFPSSVEVIRLGWNAVRTVAADTFSALRNLRRVELNHNAMTHLELKALRLHSAAGTRVSHTEFFLAGNPFNCDCDMEWLTRVNSLSSSLRSHPLIVDMDSIVCHLEFTRYYGPTRSLIQMKPQDFLCSYDSHCFALCHCCEFDACDCQMTCPAGCSCYHDDTWTANVVDCGGGNHSSIPSNLPMDSTEVFLDGSSDSSEGGQLRELKSHGFIGRKNLRVLYLNSSGLETIANKSFNGLHSLQLLQLSGNKLVQLHGYEFEQLGRLRELFLNDNLIRSISNNTFLPLKSLEVLNIAGNRLVTYSVWQLSLNRNLVVVRLSANSWDCQCEFFQHLYKWTVENSARIADSSELRCAWNRSGRTTPGPYILAEYNATCLITPSSSTWPLIQLLPVELEPLVPWLAAGLLVLLVIFSFVVVLRLSESVQYGIFWVTGVRINGSLCCGCCTESTASTEDSEKCLDAWIICSEADSEFVTKRIVDELEDNGDYRLGLLHRDSNQESMQIRAASAPTIVIVFTPNFFYREWANLEFRQMILQSLQLSSDKSASLIHPQLPAATTTTSHKSPKLLLILKDESPEILSNFANFFPSKKVRKSLKNGSRAVRWASKSFWTKLRFHLGKPRQQQHLHYSGKDQSDCTSSSYAYSSSASARHLPGSSASSVYKPSTPSLLRTPRAQLKNNELIGWSDQHQQCLPPPPPLIVPQQQQPEPPPHFQEILRKNNFNLNNYATYLSQMSQGSTGRGRLYAGRANYGSVNGGCYGTKGQVNSSSPLSSATSATESTVLESSEAGPNECHADPQQYIYSAAQDPIEEPEHVYFSLEPVPVMSSPKLPTALGHRNERANFQNSALSANNNYTRPGERKLQTFLV